jgi:hypothetical protein
MHYTKIFTILAVSLAMGFLGCTTDKKVEAPKQERVEKNLVPPKAEVMGKNFAVVINDLKVSMMVDTASKEIVDTPTLRGNIKITNKTKGLLDIQAVTLEYLDEAGKPIAYKSEEKMSKVYPFWKTLKPEETTEGNLDTTIPGNAIKAKALSKIQVDLVYVPSPLSRDTLTLSEKVE